MTIVNGNIFWYYTVLVTLTDNRTVTEEGRCIQHRKK